MLIHRIGSFTAADAHLNCLSDVVLSCGRLDEIATDAGLQSKSSAELALMANMLHTRCVEAEAKKSDIPDEGIHSVNDQCLSYIHDLHEFGLGKKKSPPAGFQIGGVSVNAVAVLKREEELDALHQSLPDNVEARRKYRLAKPVKNAQWGLPWTAKDDAMLLVGVYEHGFGNWEAIKSDSSLGLSDKVRRRICSKMLSNHVEGCSLLIM